MYLFSRNTTRRLCALTLACTMLTGPVLASQEPASDGVVSAVYTAYQSYQESIRLHYTEKLTLAGYSPEETAFLLKTLPSYRLPTLLRYSYSPAVVQFVSQPHFTDTKLDRYLSYGAKHPDLTPTTVVTQVNIGLDRSFYTSVQLVKEPSSLTVLVNKYHYLSSKFTPELVSMEKKYAAYSGASMHPEAYQWFTKMVDDAAAQGLWLSCVSAYRSHSYQNTLYTRYVKQNGQKLADTFSARPGYSEHQTGLAVDINTASTSAHFENTKQYAWLSENAWKYGFILRYPQDKQHITGFRFEPWHYRYVGQELAKAIYDSGLTLEEYLMGPPQTQTDLPAGDTEAVTTPTEPPATEVQPATDPVQEPQTEDVTPVTPDEQPENSEPQTSEQVQPEEIPVTPVEPSQSSEPQTSEQVQPEETPAIPVEQPRESQDISSGDSIEGIIKKAQASANV